MITDIRKKRHNLFFDSVPVSVIDNTALSNHYFNIIELPSIFTAGKNLIKFKVNYNNGMQPYSKIKIEITDVKNVPIYFEYRTSKTTDDYDILSVYIYPDTNNGQCTLTFLGVTDYDYITNQPIKNEWINKYNVKWNKKLYVNTHQNNLSDIIFDTYPDIVVNKHFSSYNDLKYNSTKNITALKTNGFKYQRFRSGQKNCRRYCQKHGHQDRIMKVNL